MSMAPWIDETRAQAERLIADLAAAEIMQVASMADQFVETLAPPPDRLHLAVVSTLLLGVCWRADRALHARVPSSSCTCAGVNWGHAAAFARWDEIDPRLTFRAWVQRFLEHFQEEHAPTAVMRAAAIMRADSARHWTLAELARVLEARAEHLRRDFRNHFAMTPSAYLQLTRVISAVSLLRSTLKVEAIAWEVGYRSKKDLYAALRRWAAATPSEIRALSDEECRWLDRQLRITALVASGGGIGRSKAPFARHL